MNRSQISHGAQPTTISTVETIQPASKARNSHIVNERFKGAPRTLREGNTSRLMSDCATVVGVDTVGRLSGAFRNTPWASPSVQELSSQMGHSRHATPIIIETPIGDVLSAVGSSADHVIATRIIQASRETHGMSHTPRLTSRYRQPPSFGAVYEHRDCFGVPKFIATTGQTPEAAIAGDMTRYQAVKNMLTYEAGSSKVVWAGAGRGVVGNREMEAITKGIMDKRAAELHAEKLRGPKPYSRHGY